jgi:hypothetical protein
MTNVIQTPSQMPSILAMVQRVKRECGLPVPTTLVGTTDMTAMVVLSALGDATVDIYVRKRWEWKQSLYGLPLVVGATQYPLPADFERMCTDPTAAGYPVRGLSLEEWQMMVPMTSINAGSPQYYTVHGFIFEIWPAPNAEYIAQYPILPFIYYRKPPRRLDGTDDSDNINLPPEFEDALIAYGKWKTKEFLEYPDSQSDHQRYEVALQVQMNADQSLRKAPRMRHGGVVRSKIWS